MSNLIISFSFALSQIATQTFDDELDQMLAGPSSVDQSVDTNV